MKSPSGFVLLSIQSEHADRIYSGKKKAELRKSFTESARIVFLYETAPVSAITGAFLVRQATRSTVSEAVDIAERFGVPKDRAVEYYGKRDSAWVITISSAVKFGKAIPLNDLRLRDHYFSVPQTFAYLNKYEGLTQDLISVLCFHLESELKLRPLSPAGRTAFDSLIRSEVGSGYDDIDDDFVNQVLDAEVGKKSAFSTIGKRVFEFAWRDELIGFSVVTEKSHGSWKTGPSILLPPFRGIGFGQEMRRVVECFCRESGARAIYCTCSDSKPLVVSYLLNSGMQLQARLRSHLSRNSDELVFSKSIVGMNSGPVALAKASDGGQLMKIARSFSSDERTARVINFFIRNMSKWYFDPHEGLGRSIMESLKSFEIGMSAYSVKSRAIYGGYDRNGRVRAAVLLTPKRSGMAKINIVSTIKDKASIRRLLEKVLLDFSHCRRIYLTVPSREISSIEALVSSGFCFEGMLTDPFGNGLDHACFGRINEMDVNALRM
ncbi:hypothetical protein [Zoogloea sp.]|uniref:hypothetical protein n=1 Tax=Zoogloea sp. TaxID=49181 RepID=UPI0014162165|nr:MAG: hypothetical protein F9K15_13445 [Zoogloea sp.]